MSRIIMCLDCPDYQTGGYCRHKHKDVGALQPACDYALKMSEKFNQEDEETGMEPAAPEPPKEETRQMEYKEERNQKRREARAAKRPLPEKIEGKRCPHCGRDLPLSEYYLKAGKPAWICKECFRKYEVARAKAKRDAKSAQENAGATTKVCKTCGRELPLDAFGRHARTWDHKATVCKECMIEKLTKNKEKGKNGSDCVCVILEEKAPTPAPVIDEGIRTVKATPVDEPILLAETETDPAFKDIDSQRLVDELRLRGYTVKCTKPITVIEEL